jgi:AraC-like DNA-binding protein
MTAFTLPDVFVRFDSVARSVALDTAAVFAACGLQSAAAHEMPAAAAAAVLESAASQSGREDFGLLMAEAWSLSDMGALGLALVHQETLGDALNLLARLLGAPEVRVAGERAPLPVGLMLRSDQAGRQATEYAAGRLLKLCRAMLGPDWTPEGVRFRHAAPEDPAPCRRLFSRLPEFGALTDALWVRREDLEARVPHVFDPGFRRLAEALAESLSVKAEPGLVEAASALIRRGLPDGGGNLAAVAEGLGLNARTFQRRLRAEGLAFSDLLDQVRRQLAEAYLTDSALPLARLAERLGYADSSAFSRWFSEQYGQSPSRWRDEQARADAPAPRSDSA